MHTLHVPTSLNLVKINPFRGTALIVLDPKLVFAVVDNFFGGTGRHAKIEGREFTATEQRIIHIVLRSVFADLREAWSHVAAHRARVPELRDQSALRQHRLAVGDRGRDAASTSSWTAPAAISTSPCPTR